MIAKFEAQEVELNRLKARVKLLEDRDGVATERSGDDAPIKGRNLDKGEAADERVSDDTEEMATVLTSMDAATVLASGIARDAEVARIHVEEELQSMIDGLDKSNETVAKYLQEYQQFASELPLERRIELISNLVRYQDNYAKVYKFQTQQRKPWSKKKKRDYYMDVIRSNLGWKVRGMSFEEIEAKFTTVWKQLKDFIPMGSKEEAERLKRKGLSLEQESEKKLKSSDEVPEEVKLPDEVPEEKVKEMMQLVPIEEVYVEALQVKHPIIDWKAHTEGKRIEWKLYDSCGVHHVTARDKEIFMLIEKDYPLRKGLAIVMISYKLQVKNYSRMANDLILKIFKIASTPRQQEEVPTASEESFHCQKKRDAIAKRIALLGKCPMITPRL
uniref:Uncharacterized protein n=1 Tax=Tanacetum cinerariifolium TaxID=118510 RepID=A0A6L2JQN4_TANCI|nr:hypothetical protein [Tanacetum cinerariifolium]